MNVLLVPTTNKKPSAFLDSLKKALENQNHCVTIGGSLMSDEEKVNTLNLITGKSIETTIIDIGCDKTKLKGAQELLKLHEKHRGKPMMPYGLLVITEYKDEVRKTSTYHHLVIPDHDKRGIRKITDKVMRLQAIMKEYDKETKRVELHQPDKKIQESMAY